LRDALRVALPDDRLITELIVDSFLYVVQAYENVRALVLGQTGVEKKSYIDALVAYARVKRGLPTDDSDRFARGYVRAYHIEEAIKAYTGNPTIQPFLDRVDAPGRRATWRQVVSEQILDPLKDEPSDHAILSMHAFFYRNNHFFTPIDWSSLKVFNPTAILTLIDDCYDVVARVNVVREKKGPTTQSNISLGEALLWRSVEMSAADLIANSFGVPHYVLAVKQPIETGYRLLFMPNRLRIYASYPVSSTREKPTRVAEINENRKVLHHKYAVFDPVSIDEYRAIPPRKKGGKWKHLARWPIEPIVPCVVAAQDYAPRVWGQLQRLESLISSQIEERDYRLIDQSEVVVAYRPFWGGAEYPSQGVEKEIFHAVMTNKQVYYYDPPEDRSDRKKRPFKVIEHGIRCETKDKLYSELARFQEARPDESLT